MIIVSKWSGVDDVRGRKMMQIIIAVTIYKHEFGAKFETLLRWIRIWLYISNTLLSQLCEPNDSISCLKGTLAGNLKFEVFFHDNLEDFGRGTKRSIFSLQHSGLCPKWEKDRVKIWPVTPFRQQLPLRSLLQSSRKNVTQLRTEFEIPRQKCLLRLIMFVV